MGLYLLGISTSISRPLHRPLHRPLLAPLQAAGHNLEYVKNVLLRYCELPNNASEPPLQARGAVQAGARARALARAVAGAGAGA